VTRRCNRIFLQERNNITELRSRLHSTLGLHHYYFLVVEHIRPVVGVGVHNQGQGTLVVGSHPAAGKIPARLGRTAGVVEGNIHPVPEEDLGVDSTVAVGLHHRKNLCSTSWQKAEPSVAGGDCGELNSY